MQAIYLPPELRDCVIDLLEADHASLKACSLTCHAWLPRTRYHLFRSVQIAPGRRGKAFRALLDGNPALGKHIQDVEILGSSTDAPIERVVRMEWPTLRPTQRPLSPPIEEGCASWLQNALPTSTSVLQRVSCLKLVAVHIHNELADLLFRHFPSIKTIVMSKCRSATFADFVALPCMVFYNVENVQINEIHWLRSTLPPTPQTPRPATLRSLALSPNADDAFLLSWLISQGTHTRLESLSCHSRGQPSAVAIRDLLTAVGSSLQHLSFGFSDVRDPTVILRSAELSLQPATGLRSLRIYCSNSRSSSLPSLSWIILMLSKMNSPHLQELELVILASHVPALNLEGLAVILSHSRHASLDRLIFSVIQTGDALDEIEGRIRTRMSSLTAKGLNVDIVSSARLLSA
ncbi:hypothetical protein BDW22DRAFT_1429010 [Trametopsis cervina]|nr:hypothetical protein BDW22DRAFT_1429010 [Trametopsis cervina]